MAKKEMPSFPASYHDFYKTNGETHVFVTEGPSLTRQEFLLECDINTIMKQYDSVGAGINGLPQGVRQPYYADFTSVPDSLLGFMTFMQEAEAAFMSLPAVVRKEFDNDAVAFVDFASDPENLEQMRTWGLAPPKEAPKPPEPAPGAANSSPPGSPPAAPAASPAPAAGAPTHGST